MTTLAVGIFAPNVLAACFGGSSKQAEKAKPPAEASLTFRPADKATKVLPTAAISVEVRDGWFQHLALTNSAGKVVAGTLNRDRTIYTITEPLGYDATYTWKGSAVGHDGKAVPVNANLTTVAPTKVIDGGFQLADGQTVGVAVPVIIQFDAPITDKAAVERALKVTTEPPVEGSWAWLPDEAQGARVHWRTREYYPAGTKVSVDAKLYGLAFGDGAYGKQDMSLSFDIGRRQVVKAEVSSHRIQVVRDEGVIMDFPCSYGEADKARNVTRNGIHVVSEKYSDFYMSNPAGRLQPHPRTLGGADLQQRRVHPRQPVQRRRAGQHQRHQRLHQPVDGRCPAVLRQRDLRRPGRGDRQLDRAVLLRRRHLGLGGRLGHLGGHVGAAAGQRSQAVAGVDTAQRAGHAARCADVVGHPDTTGLALDPAASGCLVARPDDDLVEVDVRRPRRHEPDHLGDVGGHQRRHAVIDGVGTLLVAAEADE